MPGKAAGFVRTSAYNQRWMALAHARGLKVQLHSWEQPPDWRSFSRNYWTRVFEAEDGDLFTYSTGREVTHGDTTARYAATREHDPGLLLASQRSVYLRRNPPDRQGYSSRFGHHVFRLKTDDASGTRHLATLRVLQRNGTVMDSMIVRGLHLPNNIYQPFRLEYDIGHKPDGGDGFIPVRYQVYWTGADTLWVDHIRAHDWEIDPDTREPVEPPNADELFRGAYDEVILDTLATYYKAGVDPPKRFQLYDEPRWELNESVAYVDALIRKADEEGREDLPAGTPGTPGISPYNQMARDAMELYVDTVDPPELLVDYYPFFHDTPAPRQAGYVKALRGRLDWLIGGYGNARAVSLGLREDGSVKSRIPLWAVVQVHNHSNLRNPTPQEIGAQVNLALAHGATGIYYYLYHSYEEIQEDGTVRRVNGLMDRNWRRTSRLDTVEALNAKMDSLDSTLLALTSDAVFPGGAPPPTNFVRSLSDTTDYFLGTFTHKTDRSRYLMIVNEDCRPTPASRTVTVTLNATGLPGSGPYRLLDVYRNTPISAGGSNPNRPEFSVTLGPGDGTLYRVEEVLHEVTFGSSSYTLIEGGQAVESGPIGLAEDPSRAFWRARVTVQLTPAASARVRIPVEVTSRSSGYKVGNLDAAGLLFRPDSTLASFVIRAVPDADTLDARIELSFGTLPAGVVAGAPSTSTVTVYDTPNQPTGLTATPGHGQMTLRWDNPGNPGIAGWQYWARPLPARGTWTTIDRSGASTTEYTVPNLTNGKEYMFRVRAYTRGYGLTSEPVEAIPSGLRATAYNGAVGLDWVDPEIADLSGWRSRHRPVPGDWSSPTVHAGGAGTRVVEDLTNDQKYRFEVQGLDAAGKVLDPCPWRMERACTWQAVATPQTTLAPPPNRKPVLSGPDSVWYAEGDPPTPRPPPGRPTMAANFEGAPDGIALRKTEATPLSISTVHDSRR